MYKKVQDKTFSVPLALWTYSMLALYLVCEADWEKNVSQKTKCKPSLFNRVEEKNDYSVSSATVSYVYIKAAAD